MTMSIPSQDEPSINRSVASFVIEMPKNPGVNSLRDIALYDNESWNDPRDFAKSVKAISLPQVIPSTSDRRLIELENQVQRLMEAYIARDNLGLSPKINLLWKAVSKKLDDVPIRDTAGNPAAQMNFTSTKDPTREELRGKGIKSPSKLLSLKYLSQSSLAEQNRNPSSPKRVHFVNSIVILNKENEAKEERNVKISTTKYEDHEMTVESEEEFEEETEDEIEEEEEDSPKHFDTFPTMKELRLGPRRKPSNPRKICNFMGRVKGLKVFVGNFTYECDFMVLEDTTSVIDHDLGSVIFGKPFIEATGLVYDREEGTITFEKDKEKIVFKMPHKMEMFKHIDFTDIKTDRIPPFAIESDDDSSEKTHYSDSLDLGSEYKHDENVCRAIRSLIAMKAKRNKGEVT
ncbi:MAK10-like protein [Tanacetum coccineum]